jgi:hypothetical protein
MKVYVFSEFANIELLSKYYDIIDVGSYINKNSSEEEKITAKTNIKIFFDDKDKSDAYELKDKLEKDGVATFITDQLYVTRKDLNGNPREIALPKDRIVMKYII